MAGVGSKCTRRKQANPRRKNFELEEPMPEDTDLNVEIAELAAPAESFNVESKDLIKIKSSNRSNGKKELKLPHCQPIESTIMSSSLPDSNTKENKSHNEQNSAKESSNMEPSAKEVLCNTSICNGFVKVNNEKVSQDNNNDDHNNGEMKQSINGNGTNDSDTEQDDDDQQTQQKDNETKDDDNKTNDTQSAKQFNSENDEDDKIKEYLQRSDTAVIFPEPVTNELAKSKFEKSNCDSKDGQSTANSNDNNDDDDNGLKTDRNRMPENASSNNGVANTMLTDLLARCPQCGKLFKGPRSTLALQEHITNIHAPTSLQSKFLPASSSPTNSVASAITQDDPDKPYVCIKCKASFMHKDHLEKHEQLHSTQGQSCQLCNKSFANVYRLQRHMLSHDESQVLRKFKCPECFKAFKFKHHLKEHIRIHSGEKPFACPNCGKRFSHSGSYSSHMTSKKCLVVNLKIRKADQIRSQKSKNNNQTNMNNIVFNSQSPVNNIESLVYNSVNHSANNNNKLKHSQLLNKEDQFNLANNNNSISILKNEIGNFPPLFPLPSEFSNINSDQTIANYLSSANFPSNLPPAIFSAVAASVRLPPHYLPSSLSNYPDVANAILRSNIDKNEKNSEFFKEKYHEFNKTELFKKINTKSFFDSSDLKTMQNILQMVDGNAVINKESQSNSIQNGSINEIRSSNPSPSLTFSASSFHLPQIAPIDSPDDNKKSFSDGTKCRFCGDHFENKIDLHKHENFHCKSNQTISSKVSNEISNKDLYYNDNYGKHHNQIQIGESDDESQRDSFSYDDEMNDGKKVRVRSVLNEETVKIFRAQYEINPRPKKHDILRLSEEVKYPPRVVQVWFQNMRARDRRLGRPIPSSNQTNEMNLPESNGQKIFNELSPSFHSVVHYTIPQPLLPPISIPHYKPATQYSHSYSPSVITSSHYTCNGMELFTPTKNNEQKPSSVSKELSPSFTNKIDTNGCAEEPLDLSVKSKIKSPDVNHNISTEFEILNLSKKSNDNSNDNLLSGNVSLAILQQQQRQETLEQTSIVRSILQSKTIDMDTSPLQFNSSNNDMKKSPNYESILNKDENEIKPNLKRPHSITDELGHNSDSTNPSDEFNCSNSPSRSKLSIVPSPKIWRANVDNVISRDNQTPPDVNLQGDGSGLFTCDQCDKTFSKQSSLARHKYEHSGQRPHKCDVCSKAFKHKHHLTEHKRLHSGEKPFQCKKCLKRFSHSGSYSQHMNHRYSYCKPYRD